MGFHPISYVEIDAYSRLTGRRLRPFEVQLIRAIDRVAMANVPKPKDPGQPGVRDEVDPRADPAAAKALVRRLAAGGKKSRAKKEARKP